MNFTNAERAEVLANALPFIQKYRGEIVVVKYGGNAMTNEELKLGVMEDIVLLHCIGVHVVLVHGGGPEITQLLTALGKKSEFVDGLRVTDKESVEVVTMALAGKVNKSLVNLLTQKGGNAVGLCGIDGSLIEARVKDERLGFVGEITRVNEKVVKDLLNNGYIPVISTVARGENGETFNVNGDTAAAFVAGALNARRLVMMTDISGVLRDKNDPTSLICETDLAGARKLIESGVVQGGMIPKVQCCIDAIEAGVQNVVILDGRVKHSILLELLTNEGIGTLVRGVAK